MRDRHSGLRIIEVTIIVVIVIKEITLPVQSLFQHFEHQLLLVFVLIILFLGPVIVLRRIFVVIFGFAWLTFLP